MIKNKKTDFIKATISSVIVAFIYVAVFVFIVYLLFSSKISMAMGMVEAISIDTSKKILQDVKIVFLTIKTVLSKEGADAGKSTIQNELEDLKTQEIKLDEIEEASINI